MIEFILGALFGSGILVIAAWVYINSLDKKLESMAEAKGEHILQTIIQEIPMASSLLKGDLKQNIMGKVGRQARLLGEEGKNEVIKSVRVPLLIFFSLLVILLGLAAYLK
jgi:hypothetical protein